MSPSNKIYHKDQDELSKNNLKIINKIHSNENIELSNQLLAQAYLFLIDYGRRNFFSTPFCHWCKGCEGCGTDDGYCGKYCMHADNCEFSEFVHKLEQPFKITESLKKK